METDIRLRKFVREIITEIYDQLERGLVSSELTSTIIPGTIEEQSSEPFTLREDESKRINKKMENNLDLHEYSRMHLEKGQVLYDFFIESSTKILLMESLAKELKIESEKLSTRFSGGDLVDISHKLTPLFHCKLTPLS